MKTFLNILDPYTNLDIKNFVSIFAWSLNNLRVKEAIP